MSQSAFSKSTIGTPVAVANGGTAATTVKGARQNLSISEEVVILNGAITLTNQPNTLEIITQAVPGVFIVRRDLTLFTEVKFTGRVFTGSASGNSPRVILRYFTSASVTPADYLDIGTSEVNISMTTAGVIESAWIPLAAGAIAADRYISCLTHGGNGVADPLISGLTMMLR